MENVGKSKAIPSITALHKEKSIKENSKENIFSIVLNKCVEKIIYTNRHTSQTYIIFEVPKILIGYPNYDMKSCILFLINKLSHSHYRVDFIEPFYLYIDWSSPDHTVASSSKKIISKTQKLELQTKALLSKFPNTSKIEYVYEDDYSVKRNKKNKRKI